MVEVAHRVAAIGLLDCLDLAQGAQLSTVPASESVKPYVPGPDAIRFRPDEVKPWPLAAGPDDLAPAFKGGFFLVPKLEQFDEPEAS